VDGLAALDPTPFPQIPPRYRHETLKSKRGQFL
jgi:hypothetical protein